MRFVEKICYIRKIAYICGKIIYVMVAVLPKIDPNGLFSPKQTMSILDIGKTSLYKYDKDGLLQHEIRPENGRRVYRGKNIIKFHGTTVL